MVNKGGYTAASTVGLLFKRISFPELSRKREHVDLYNRFSTQLTVSKH